MLDLRRRCLLVRALVLVALLAVCGDKKEPAAAPIAPAVASVPVAAKSDASDKVRNYIGCYDALDASPDSRLTISIAEDEPLQHRFCKLTASPSGRHALRERIAVEHRLARKQGRRARYLEIRKKFSDVRRSRSDLETTNRWLLSAAKSQFCSDSERFSV